MNLSHPLSITLCKVIIDCDNAHSLALKCIEVCRKCRNKCLTFTGTHLCNTSLMQNNTTDYLYSIMLHAKHTLSSLSYCSKCLRKNIIKCCSVLQTLFKLPCLILQFFIGKLSHCFLIRLNLVSNRVNSLKLSLAVRTKDF